jgi:riboflavin transporter FmnP
MYFRRVFICENFKEDKTMTKTRKLTTTAVLTALSVALMMTVRFVIFNPIEYDAGNIPILIGGFVFGPAAALAITAVTALIQAVTVSAVNGLWGAVMHIISTGTFVIIASVIYQRNRTFKRAIIGLVIGALATVVIMIPANLLIQPLWNGVPVEAVRQLLLPAIIPANAAKVAINGLITVLVYKPISNLIKLPAQKKKEQG